MNIIEQSIGLPSLMEFEPLNTDNIAYKLQVCINDTNKLIKKIGNDELQLFLELEKDYKEYAAEEILVNKYINDVLRKASVDKEMIIGFIKERRDSLLKPLTKQISSTIVRMDYNDYIVTCKKEEVVQLEYFTYMYNSLISLIEDVTTVIKSNSSLVLVKNQIYLILKTFISNKYFTFNELNTLDKLKAVESRNSAFDKTKLRMAPGDPRYVQVDGKWKYNDVTIRFNNECFNEYMVEVIRKQNALNYFTPTTTFLEENFNTIDIKRVIIDIENRMLSADISLHRSARSLNHVVSELGKSINAFNEQHSGVDAENILIPFINLIEKWSTSLKSTLEREYHRKSLTNLVTSSAIEMNDVVKRLRLYRSLELITCR